MDNFGSEYKNHGKIALTRFEKASITNSTFARIRICVGWSNINKLKEKLIKRNKQSQGYHKQLLLT